MTPRKLNIQAYCSYNSETHTLTTDHPSTQTKYVWDTEEYQANATIPLLTSQYTLQVYDSTENMSVVASAGYLSPFSQSFYMYSPQAYTPMSEFKCVNCKNGAGFLDPTTAKWCVAMLVLFLASTIQQILA